MIAELNVRHSYNQSRKNYILGPDTDVDISHDLRFFLLPEFGPKHGMTTHSSMLAWRIPWVEESGGLQSMGLPRVRHD